VAYCSLAQVQELMAGVGQNAAFSGSTAPKDTQVTDMMAGVAAEIDMHLSSVGYTVPATTPAEFVVWLAQVNADGAVARVLKSAFPNSIVSQNGGPVIPAYAYYEKKYQDALRAIDERTVSPAGASVGSAMLARTYLTDNPLNTGNDGADGFQDADWGQADQPAFSMQRVF
jgi:hypothetical protein